MKTFNRYKEFVKLTAIYPKSSKFENLNYLFLGLVEELCEFHELIDFDLNNLKRLKNNKALEKELGDILWYLTASLIEIEADEFKLLKKDVEIWKLITELSQTLLERSYEDMLATFEHIFGWVDFVSNELGLGIDEIIETNTKKLESRMARNTLKGSGNDR